MQAMDRGMFITDGMSEESVLAMIKKIRPVRVDVPLVRIGPNMDGGYLVPDDFDDPLSERILQEFEGK